MTTSATIQLNIFREKYHSVRVKVFSDSLVYTCAWGFSKRAVKRANALITELDLNLVALVTGLNSYIIKSSDYEL